ncbi:hypothetical protein [Streptomyces tirandamycinicus]|uniref:Uncharacterized protein n=1 Tax=Streptomyces tirandamycinicus TaxID=2174846 RepID=A0A2S1SQF4_9ACTN|nr:hypothetical protein [Streptomyces tirandamycinicus]AWI28626.1 hypothetical protein DDW44_07380 [Streptomyces tirandamycinicus]
MIGSPDRTPPPRAFFGRPVPGIAPDAPGRILVRSTEDGRACRGRTARDGAMDAVMDAVVFGPPGHAYVHGMPRRSA